MKLIILAFIISLTLHLLLFNTFKSNKNIKTNQEKTLNDIKKVKVNFVNLKKTKKIPSNETNQKKQIKKRITKPSKKIVKKEKKKKKLKKSKTISQKKIKKAKEFQKKVLKNQIIPNKKSIQEKTLEDFLSQKEPVNQEILNQIEKLYGREYQNFTKLQKAFIKNNIDSFQIITQRVLDRLGYPIIASKMRIQGKNIVEFIFYPNGNIKNLKISSSSSYNILDEYTLELIKIAYKEYPKPKTPTKLKFIVHYRLY